MSILPDIVGQIRTHWMLEPKKAIHRGKELSFPLKCHLNSGEKFPFNISPDLLLPDSLKTFYSLSNGAELFKDESYGQWGLKLYELSKLSHATECFKNERNSDFVKGDLIIGEFYGDSEYLLVRCDPHSPDYGYVYIVLPLDQRVDWYIASQNFEKFIQKFYDFQGDKFWEINT